MSSVSFDDPDHFTAGTTGEPGQRTFFIQVAEGDRLLTLRCEKQQVSGLAEYLQGVLADLPPVEPGGAGGALRTPVEDSWTVGQMALAHDEAAGRIVLEIAELSEDPVAEDDENASRVRLRLTPAQVAAFIDHATELVASGRPPCPVCGNPRGPDHVCPRSNGHGPPS